MSSVNFKGIQEAIQHMGFTLSDGAAELGDNELDAGATILRYIFKTSSNTIAVAGNGSGMDENQLVRSVCYFANKEASTSAGRFGLGENAAHIVLSGALTATNILTRTAGATRPLEVIANWPKAAAEDVWQPSAHPISYDSMALWNEHAINPNGQGSVKVIQMPVERYNEMIGNLPSFLKELAFAYEKHLQDGKTIEVIVDGVKLLPDWSLTLNYESTPSARRSERNIELWKNGENERIYYHHSNRRPIYSEMVREDSGSNKKIRDYENAPSDGYTLVASFTLRSIYDPTHGGVDGYFALCRGERSLCRLTGLSSKSGDFECRNILSASRHSLSFTHREDALMGVETNKSRVRPENVHKGILKTATDLARQWCNEYYGTIKKASATAPVDVMVLERRIKKATAALKRLANSVPGFMDELETFMYEFETSNDSDQSEEA
jgi:hypothetical protein